MGNGWVVFAYTVVYGFMVGYTIYLVRRLRVLGEQVADRQAAEAAAPAGAAITAPDLERLRGER